MHAFWKLVKLPFLLFLLPLPLCAQHAFYVNSGFRVFGYPVQSYSTKYGHVEQISTSKPQPGIKLEAGIVYPLAGDKQHLELGLGYSINPVNYIRTENSYTSPPPPAYHKAQDHITGIDYFAETIARFSKRIGKKNNWEIVAGVRFSFLYFNGRKNSYHLQEYRREDDGLGNFTYIGTSNSRETYRPREFNLRLIGWPEIGIRSWCFMDGQAGLELHSGLSSSSIFTKKNFITSYFLGISYLRRWNRVKKK